MYMYLDYLNISMYLDYFDITKFLDDLDRQLGLSKHIEHAMPAVTHDTPPLSRDTQRASESVVNSRAAFCIRWV